MKHSLTLALSLALALTLSAQPPHRSMHGRPHHPRMEQAKGAMQQRMAMLNLTDAQKEKMKALHADFREKMKVLRANENITVKAQRDQMFDLQRKHHAEMKAVLTPEQQQKLQSMREMRGNQMQDHALARLSEKLSLTDAQKAEWKKQQQQHKAAMQALRNSDNPDRTSMTRQVQALMQKHRRELEKMLTAEQRAKWTEMQQQRPGHGGRKAGRPGRGMHAPQGRQPV